MIATDHTKSHIKNLSWYINLDILKILNKLYWNSRKNLLIRCVLNNQNIYKEIYIETMELFFAYTCLSIYPHLQLNYTKAFRATHTQDIFDWIYICEQISKLA